MARPTTETASASGMVLTEAFNRDFAQWLSKKHDGNVIRAAGEAGMDRADFQGFMRASA